MFATSHELLFLSAALVPAVLAAVFDLRERRIPNRLTATATIAGIFIHTALQGWPGLASSMLALLIAGCAFLLFFLAGGMGAGDVKLMAALGAIVGLPALPATLLATAFTGALAALAVALYHRKFVETLRNTAALLLHHGREGLRPHPELNLSNTHTIRLPFAVPIALGCAGTVIFTAWSRRW